MEAIMKRTLVSVGALLTLGVSLAFASGGGQSSAGSTASGGIPGDRQPFGKFNPAITVTSAKSIMDKFETGDTIDKNPWITKNLNDLGINVKWAWTTENTGNQYTTKMTASIASGDLPDIFEVNALQLDMLVQSGLVWDMTDIYETYVSPLYRRMMDADPAQVSIAQFGGRLMAMPLLGSTSDSFCIFVRQDWLDKLGLQPPKTIQDVLNIAQAFATRDPDGNGQNDTVGLMLSQDLWSAGAGRASEFMAGYHAYPDGWVQDSSGSLVYGAIQPEMKTTLASLADLYKKGYIDQEFAATDSNAANEKVLSGKVGLFYGSFPYPLSVREFENMNPTGKLAAYPIVSNDRNPAKVMMNNPVSSFWVVNKKFAHPEALIKLMNINYEQGYGETADMSMSISPSGYGYWTHNIVRTGYPNKNLNAHLALKAVLAGGDASKLDGEQTFYLDYLRKYINRDRADTMAYGYYWVFGPEPTTTFGVMDQYVKNGQIMLNAFYGPPTETMTARQSTLESLRDETFTKIIMGSSPVDAFDTFVRDWKRQGGDDITKEVNDWYKKTH
jgi:putative aldouronate transport system substrate-binding protein